MPHTLCHTLNRSQTSEPILLHVDSGRGNGKLTFLPAELREAFHCLELFCMTQRPIVSCYYWLKPLIPWRVRMRLRRVIGLRTLRKNRQLWPINESLGEKPANWKGWPTGKQFAFVLTHDVEGVNGVEKCRALAEFEMKHGFRSSFNFVPEGGYQVADDLLEWLRSNGFEVGVHDLHHEGGLYASRRVFRARAEKINSYLHKWHAVGFRSGFMFHNLEWLADLDVLYDASTFDWDPFEPQPDGAGTIFPFRVGAGSKKHSYIELPYTLAQDSTLFHVLGERGIESWTRKLDWLASKKGMALVNVHPDYVGLLGAQLAETEFPVSRYGELLKCVRDRYEGAFWHALPRQVAEYVADFAPVRDVRRRLRVAMVTQSVYETDNRVMRYAETLATRGDEVEVISVGWGKKYTARERIRGVEVARIQHKSVLHRKRIGYGLRVLSFVFKAALLLAARRLHRRYDLVHAHNMPDFVVYASLVPRLFGAKVILDIHDLVPELYGAKFTEHRHSLYNSLLLQEEKWSARFANHVIVANDLWLKRVQERSAGKRPCTGLVNYVDTGVFARRQRRRSDERKILLFHGSLSEHQGVDLVVQAMPVILQRLPYAEFHVYGVGGMEDRLRRMAADLALGSHFQLNPPVNLQEIPNVIVEADVGVVPKRADSFGDTAFSTKILEFMSQGVPVVVSSTTVDRHYFKSDTVRFFPSGDVRALAEAVVAVLQQSELRRELIVHGDEYVARNCWAAKSGTYLQIVDGLCDR